KPCSSNNRVGAAADPNRPAVTVPGLAMNREGNHDAESPVRHENESYDTGCSSCYSGYRWEGVPSDSASPANRVRPGFCRDDRVACDFGSRAGCATEQWTGRIDW